jgi:type I restriction enzyme S subunit
MKWKSKYLDEIATTSSGGTPSRTVEKYWNGNIPWIKSGQLKDGYITDCDEFITEDGMKNSSASLVLPGTLLLALYGATAGKLAFTSIEATTNQAVCAISTNDKLVNNKYLFYFLLSRRAQILNDAAGGAQPNISQGYVRNIKVPLPPLHIQEQIADTLDKADTLRKKDQELLQKYDKLTQAIFYDIFGDPVRNDKGWEVKKLKDISIKIHSGNTPKGGSNVYVKKGITFFRSQNVWKNNLVYDDIAYIKESTHRSMIKSSLLHRDILMTKTGRINTENSSLGRAAIFLGEDNSANVNGHVYLIRLQKNQVNEFVLHILTSKEYLNLIREVCVGGIDKRQLNKDHIEDFPIIYPSLKLQHSFVEKLLTVQNLKKISENAAKISSNIFNRQLSFYFP